MMSRQRQTGTPDSSYILYASVLSIILLSGILAFPVQDGDSINFLPAAKSWAEGHGLANKVAEIASHTDVTGNSQFNYYVPGLPLLLGGLARVLDSDSYRELIEIASLVKAISTVLLAASIEVTSRRLDLSQRHKIKFLILILFVAFSVSSPFPLTRPELGVLLCSASAALVAVLGLNRKLRNLVLAILSGSAGLFSFVGGLISLAVLILYLYRVKTPARDIAVLITAAVLVFQSSLILILFKTSIGISSFINGFMLHASLALSRDDWAFSSLIRNGYWWVPMFGYSYITFISTSLRRLRDQNEYYSKLELVPAALALAALLIGFVKLFLMAPEASYNFVPLYPIVIVYLLHELGARRHSWGSRLERRFLQTSSVTSLAPALYFLICLTVHIESDYRYTRALVDFESALNQFKECRPYITSGLFTLDEEQATTAINWRRFSYEALSAKTYDAGSTEACKLLIIQEVNGAYVKELTKFGLPNLKEVRSSTVDQTDTSWLTLFMQKHGVIKSPKGYSSRMFVLAQEGSGI